ncbi:MAG: hypothetical protein ACREPD_17390 [Stenotrophomonas sp.]|uniref:hypothetical protein n=1 Tax=Stenotrophomonas sp. TaxID=69392 RepID=UPI003D6D4637
MAGSLRDFPIDGQTLVGALAAACEPDELWVLTLLEVNGYGGSERLRALVEQFAAGPLEVTTRALCEALANASQIITFDARLAADAAMELYIEDGEVYIDNLSSRRGGERYVISGYVE